MSPNGGLDYESKEFGMLIVAQWPLLFCSRSVCFTEFDPEAVGGAKEEEEEEEVPPLWNQKATFVVLVSGLLGKKWSDGRGFASLFRRHPIKTPTEFDHEHIYCKIKNWNE